MNAGAPSEMRVLPPKGEGSLRNAGLPVSVECQTAIAVGLLRAGRCCRFDAFMFGDEIDLRRWSVRENSLGGVRTWHEAGEGGCREGCETDLYGVHPGVAMVQKWVMELKGKTGRSVEESVALIKKDGPRDEKARREWLKSKHKLGTNSAWWLAERADGKGGGG